MFITSYFDIGVLELNIRAVDISIRIIS